MSDAYTFGIEEEYFLVDADTKAAAQSMPAALLAQAKAATRGRVTSEMLQSQIEIATAPHTDIQKAREELRYLRQTLARVAADHGLAILAAGTHPTATWSAQQPTAAERYDAIMEDLQMVGQRDMLCGLHVHIELPDPAARLDLMIRMLPYLPLFVALATSSPFWQSRPTGLKGYRLAAYDELPRTGVPDLFRTTSEYDEYIAALVRAGVIADSSYVWWAIRPSRAHPTLELRAPDCCTRLEDSIAIASLYRALARLLTRTPSLNAGLSPVSRALVIENKWRAQRYGVHGTFVDATLGAVKVPDVLEHIIGAVEADARALGSLAEIEHCRDIARSGTSADAQLAVFARASEQGAHRDEPLRAVIEWIARATLQ